MIRSARGLGLVVLALTMLAPTYGAAAPPSSGEFSMPIQSDPNMIPTVGFDTASVMVNKVLFNGLTKPDEQTQSPVPDLAESWRISGDGLVWTFKLRAGMKWHDGAPVTADDVKFTLDQVRDPKVNSRWRTNFLAVKEVKVTAPLEVQFILSEPFSPLPVFLGYNMGIVPKHVLEGTNVSANLSFTHKNPIGTGPYKMQEVRPGEYVRFVANPSFHFGAPKIPAVNFKIIPDQNVQIAQLKTGELTFAWIEPFSLKALENTPGIVINQGNQINFYYLSLNKTNPLFQDRRVRLALTLGLNRPVIVQGIMKGYARLASHPWNPFLKDYYVDTTQIPYDAQKARALLAEAGWKAGPNGVLEKGGKPFSFQLTTLKGNPSLEQIAVLTQQYWKQLGVDPKLEAAEFSVFIKERRDNRFGPNASQALVHFWVTPPTADLYDYFGCPAGKDGNNTGVYCNQAADALFLEGRRATTVGQQKQIYQKLQEVFAQDLPEVPLFYPIELRAMSANLRNMSPLGIRDALLYSYKWSFAK